MFKLFVSSVRHPARSHVGSRAFRGLKAAAYRSIRSSLARRLGAFGGQSLDRDSSSASTQPLSPKGRVVVLRYRNECLLLLRRSISRPLESKGLETAGFIES